MHVFFLFLWRPIPSGLLNWIRIHRQIHYLDYRQLHLRNGVGFIQISNTINKGLNGRNGIVNTLHYSFAILTSDTNIRLYAGRTRITWIRSLICANVSFFFEFAT